MSEESIIHGNFENNETNSCCPECPDLEESITLELTPLKIICSCFLNGGRLHLTKEPYQIRPEMEDVTTTFLVEADVGSCRLHYEEGCDVDPEGHGSGRHVIDLDLGDVHIWSIFEHDFMGFLRPDYYAALAEEDFIRACILLGEKVAYRIVHHINKEN